MEVAKLSLKVEHMGLMLAEELILEIAPGSMSRDLSQHQWLLQVIRDGAINSRQGGAVCLHPR